MAFEINAQQLGLELGTGAAIGGLTGFAVKKVAKIIAVIVGLELALFKFLESRDILNVHWSKLGAAFLDAGETAASGQPPSWIMSILSTVSMGGGFAGGFYLGWQKG